MKINSFPGEVTDNSAKKEAPVWNFTEPLEGESDCDHHFAQIGSRIK